MGCNSTKLPTTGCDELPLTPTITPTQPHSMQEMPSLTLPPPLASQKEQYESREIHIPIPPPEEYSVSPPSPIITPTIIAVRKETNEQAPYLPDFSNQVEITLQSQFTKKVELNCPIPLDPPLCYRSITISNKKICQHCGRKKSKHIAGKMYYKIYIRPVRSYRCDFCNKMPCDLIYYYISNTSPSHDRKTICSNCYIHKLRSKLQQSN